jgi:hypothetical protein
MMAYWPQFQRITCFPEAVTLTLPTIAETRPIESGGQRDLLAAG